MTLAERCGELIAAELATRTAWCELLAGGRMPEPDVLVESQRQLHAAAERLRRACEADPAAAETARRELMRRQVEGDLRHEVAIRRTPAKVDREVIRRAWVAERIQIIDEREAITVGLGWPARGEAVVVDVIRAESGTEQHVAGPGVYLHSNDTYDIGHVVWVPALGGVRYQCTLLILWTPRVDDEWADPAGDIAIRRAAAPHRRLPVPLPRWPKVRHIEGELNLEATVPAGEMVPLFGLWEVQ